MKRSRLPVDLLPVTKYTKPAYRGNQQLHSPSPVARSRSAKQLELGPLLIEQNRRTLTLKRNAGVTNMGLARHQHAVPLAILERKVNGCARTRTITAHCGVNDDGTTDLCMRRMLHDWLLSGWAKHYG